jgi:hypothetical protein
MYVYVCMYVCIGDEGVQGAEGVPDYYAAVHTQYVSAY